MRRESGEDEVVIYNMREGLGKSLILGDQKPLDSMRKKESERHD